jgi:glutathione S-transferase
MLEEIGRPYQLIDKSTAAGDLQTADYLRLKPTQRLTQIAVTPRNPRK